MSEVDKVTDNAIKNGGILAILHFDIHGNTKDGIQQLGVNFIQRLLKEKGVIYARGQIEEPIKDEELFSTSVEVKILTKTFIDLANVCGSYSPFSVEVLKPDVFPLTIDKMHELLMHFSTTTHEYKRYIFEKISTGKDLEHYKRNIQSRMKLGKMLLEKKKK